jgi:hypothetical protein
MSGRASAARSCEDPPPQPARARAAVARAAAPRGARRPRGRAPGEEQEEGLQRQAEAREPERDGADRRVEEHEERDEPGEGASALEEASGEREPGGGQIGEDRRPREQEGEERGDRPVGPDVEVAHEERGRVPHVDQARHDSPREGGRVRADLAKGRVPRVAGHLEVARVGLAERRSRVGDQDPGVAVPDRRERQALEGPGVVRHLGRAAVLEGAGAVPAPEVVGPVRLDQHEAAVEQRIAERPGRDREERCGRGDHRRAQRGPPPAPVREDDPEREERQEVDERRAREGREAEDESSERGGARPGRRVAAREQDERREEQEDEERLRPEVVREGDEVRIERGEPGGGEPRARAEPAAAELEQQEHREGAEQDLRQLRGEEAPARYPQERGQEDGVAGRLPGSGVLREVDGLRGVVAHPRLVGADEALAVEERLGAQPVGLLVEHRLRVARRPQGREADREGCGEDGQGRPAGGGEHVAPERTTRGYAPAPPPRTRETGWTRRSSQSSSRRSAS